MMGINNLEENLLLSICIPTNGMANWVVPVLESIYCGESDINKFEVIITDNGDNDYFEDAITSYLNKYNNIIYTKTHAKMFLNQIESFKLAKGMLIKFLNHRMTLKSGSLEYWLEFVEEYCDSKPGVYFSNGKLGLNPKRRNYVSFDDYVRQLSYWSSWSAGTAMWRDDFVKMDLGMEFNHFFPHTDIVFFDRNKTYVIDDECLLCELPTDNTKKGNYDIFNAFAVEYPNIIEHLFKNGDISEDTYEYILNKNSDFICELYSEYMLRHSPCSYNLNGFNKAMGKYYSKREILTKVFYKEFKGIVKKIAKYE